jgi:hypothetical protein
MSHSPSGFQGYCQPADDCFTRQSVFSEKPAPKRRGALIRNPSLSERDKTDQDVAQTGVCRQWRPLGLMVGETVWIAALGFISAQVCFGSK